MIEICNANMDLAQLAGSGQSFTWHALDAGRWGVAAFGRHLEVTQQGDRFTLDCDEAEFEAIWRTYFDLDTDYAAIRACIDPEDAYLCGAADFGHGVRVLRQDLWEVMVSFLISQNNNISRIRASVTGLCARYGEKRKQRDGVHTYHTFPTPDALAQATAADFGALGLGYRAKYLEALARELRGHGLPQLRSALDAAGDDEAVALLRGLYGIGPKVADCIALFGLHRIDRFPVDTHIRKVLAAHYPHGFPLERYRGCLGILQQYMFYADL